MNRTRTLDPQDTAAHIRETQERVRREGLGFMICDRTEWDRAPIEFRRMAAQQVIRERLGGLWAWTDRDGIQCAEHPLLGYFVFLPGFWTQIGSPENEEGRYSDEGPMYRIYVEPFFMGMHNVTERVWNQVLASERIEIESNLPKTMISWLDSKAWMEKASAIAGVEIAFPWEEEWEGACRAGSTTPYFWGTDPAMADQYAWHSGNSGGRVHEVGELKPNAWGLYDMIGNVWEWCRDEWTPDHSAKAATADGVAKTRMAIRQTHQIRCRVGVRPPAPPYISNARGASRLALSRNHGRLMDTLTCEEAGQQRESSVSLITGTRHSASLSTSNAQAASELALSQRAHPSILSHGSEGSAELPEPLSGHRAHRSVTTDSTTADSASPSASNAEAASRFCLPSSAEDAETGLAHRGDCLDTPKDQSSRRILAFESQSTCN